MKIEKNVSLKEFNTFKVGGEADFFCRVSSISSLKKAVDFAKKNNLSIFILGGGSNILISDKGFRGLVIKIEIKGISFKEKKEKVFIKAGAGESWDLIVEKCVSKNLAGAECLSGVPGTVGAAPVQNIACYGQSVDVLIDKVITMNMKTGEEREFSKKECCFSYRNSFFKTRDGSNFIITNVVFVFDKNKKPSAQYKDYKYNLADYVKNKKPPTFTDVRSSVLKIRNKKGMTLIKGHNIYKSVGSFFKAPIVSSEMFKYVKNVSEKEDMSKSKELEPWYWVLDSREVKIAPAFLMEYTKFKKGYISGNVGISPRHSLAIINIENATASEIFMLSKKIKEEVWRKFKIKLEKEVQLVGEF